MRINCDFGSKTISVREWVPRECGEQGSFYSTGTVANKPQSTPFEGQLQRTEVKK